MLSGRDAAVVRRHRAIFDSAVDFAIVGFDTAGTVTDWNAGATRVFGWTDAEMIGQSGDRLFTPEDRERGRLAVEMTEALARGRASDDRWHMRRDGSRFWASGEMHPLRADDGQHLGFLKILRDRTQQRLAEEERAASEAFLQSVLASFADRVEVLDLAGRTLFVSPGGIQGMEIADVDAVLGASWLDLWKGADAAAVRTAIEQARAGGTGRFQGYCPTYKGTPKWWDAVVSPLPGPDGRPARLVAVSRDITHVVRAHEEAAFGEARFRLATDAAEVGTWDLDLASGQLTWSDRTKAMFGISPDVVCSMDDFYAGLHPDDRPATAEAFASALDPAVRATYDVEYRTIGKEDGVIRWVAAKGRGLFDAEGNCVRAIGTAVDVSARKAIDDRLRQSEAKLRELNATLEQRVEERTRERDRAWKNSQDLQAVIDTGGVFRAVNEAWSAVLGWRPDEVVGRSYLDFIHPEDHPSSERALATASTAELPVYENRYRHKDGSYRWISWVAASEEGLVYASGRHITAEREAAAALEAMQEQLRQSQKMEAVGQLTGGLAHDFNNLLAGISGNLELLLRRVAQGRVGDLERYVVAAQGAANRAASLTHRLLAFSRRQTLDPKPADANRLIEGMEELVRRTVGPHVVVEVVAGAGLWATLVDPNQLENALLNLCINARDAMPAGGQLTIETGNVVLDARAARTHDLVAGEYVAVSVSDSGAGMTPDVMERAFDPFFTTKPIGLGTGLGLSMVYGFARQSGGQARLYSEPGLGTRVCLYLPRHYGPDEVADAAAGAVEPARAERGETVLVVDDEQTLRTLVAEVLDDLGYGAIEAADGAAGLRVLESDRRIDVLVTDVGLPGGMNGRQLADAARKLRPGLRVLFITGFADSAVLSHGHLEPGMHVLTKPFALETLANRMRELIALP